MSASSAAAVELPARSHRGFLDLLVEVDAVLRNAAVEPEIQELIQFLQRMGAIIEPAEGRRCVIDGVERLQPSRQQVAGDRVEAFSYLAAGIATRGKVAVLGCDPSLCRLR